VKPADIKFIGISHTHPRSHRQRRNVSDRADSYQKAEYDFYFAPWKEGILKPPSDTRPTFLKDHPVKLVQEDLDVFGDGSVMLVLTAGHTPGHHRASCI